MIFGTCKLHEATSGAMVILSCLLVNCRVKSEN